LARPPFCHLLAERPVPAGTGTRHEIRAFAKCRNERLRLPAFLAHYRALGVNRFFIVDNGSSDGSAEYLRDQLDVHVYHTANRFSEARGGTTWLNALLSTFGLGFWCVTVDVDELLMYPGSEQTGLRTLTEYLDRRGHEALACLLLDLYPKGPLRTCGYVEGADLLAAAPYFDPGPYEREMFNLCPGYLIHGGPRQRVFHPQFKKRGIGARLYAAAVNRIILRLPVARNKSWNSRWLPASLPCLSKVPLVRWDSSSRYFKTAHAVSQKIVAPESGALLHFKLLQDFHARAVNEAARGEYYNGAYEYRKYASIMKDNPNLSLMYEGSVRYEGTSQLVSLGLIRDTDAWVSARMQSQAIGR
jgi:hypothetical protein